LKDPAPAIRTPAAIFRRASTQSCLGSSGECRLEHCRQLAIKECEFVDQIKTQHLIHFSV
jgi:hypothetical protein